MNYKRITLSALVATIWYFAYGFVVEGFLIAKDFEPTVYRSANAVAVYMPLGVAGMFVALLTLSVIYAKCHQRRSGVAAGASFGLLVAIFVIGAFVIHDFVILKVSSRLALELGVSALGQWVIVGILISLIHRPVLEDGRN